ncbi:MAG: TniQ family protein [Chloroflexota bacterium]|nr:TniQ family protein [Chloroflexota bacterium]
MSSVLPSLPPFGVGTADVESLSSYIRRLAWWQHVAPSQLLRVLILEPARRERGQKQLVFAPTRATESLNGSGHQVALVVAALEVLCGVQDLAELTFLGREDATSVRNGFRAMRAWCPRCLDVPVETAFDRLAWTIRVITTCLRHDTVLAERCPECGRAHGPITQWAQPDRCPWCGARLADAQTGTSDASIANAERCVARQLVAPGGPTRSEVAALLRTRIGATGLRPLSRATGVSISELSWIRSGRARPSVATLVRLALPAPGPEAARRRRTPPEPRSVRAALEAALERDMVPSLRQVAREIGSTPASLHRLAPNLARSLVRRGWRERRAGVRQRRSALMAEIRRAVRRVAARDGSVPRRAVERRLARPGILRADWARDALRTATEDIRRGGRGGAFVGYVKTNESQQREGHDDEGPTSEPARG